MTQSRTHEGRVAIVTGAGRGIGRAIAMGLAARGARLALIDLVAPAETAAAIGEDTLFVAGDISREQDWIDFAQLVRQKYGRADIVVNNAGIYPFAPLEDLDAALWRRTMAVNLDAHFYSAKYFVPLMKENGWGRFVNISSNVIGIVTRNFSHYAASKMGVIGFVRGLAGEVAEHGITINAVLPGITETEGTSTQTDAQKEATWAQQAIRRVGLPQDIVGTVLFLSSDDAAFLTGQSLAPDGGLHQTG
jgi:NAD(P)-dependent dehydrogenase (short-subunit alcohol dehydrogenase family)